MRYYVAPVADTCPGIDLPCGKGVTHEVRLRGSTHVYFRGCNLHAQMWMDRENRELRDQAASR